ncbi:MAG: FAD-binding protein [Candidatus Freyarchaeota archaeon]
MNRQKKHVDALVIGCGVAGMTAAEIIGKEGYSVHVLASGYGCTQMSSGTIDVLGRYQGEEVVDLEAKLDGFIRENPRHIYALAGKEKVIQALTEFAVESASHIVEYKGEPRRNTRIFTPLGTVKNTCLVQYTMSLNNPSELTGKKVLVVAIPGLSGYAPNLFTEGLRRRNVKARMVRVNVPVKTTFQLAHFFDLEAEGIITHLKEAGAAGFDYVAMPPVLGLRRTRSILKMLEEDFEAHFFEIPSFPPSVPGQRLHFLLEEKCEQAGVKVEMGKNVTGVKIKNGYLREVEVDKEKITPSVGVVATGWMLKSILRIKGLPFQVNESLNVEKNGERVENLFLALSSVSYENMIGLGAAITSGYLAGINALKYLREGRG